MIDANDFDYRLDTELPPDQILPGIARVGGLRAAACLIAPGRVVLHNTGTALDTTWLEHVYRVENEEKSLRISRDLASTEKIVAALSD